MWMGMTHRAIALHNSQCNLINKIIVGFGMGISHISEIFTNYWYIMSVWVDFGALD